METEMRGKDGGGGVWPFLGLPFPVDARSIRPPGYSSARVGVCEAAVVLSAAAVAVL